MGVVVPFPPRAAGQFTPEMRGRFACLAAALPAGQPLMFGWDEGRRECYRFSDVLMVGWDGQGRLVLTDIASGYVDHGPFGSLDEVCGVIASLASWTGPNGSATERRRAAAGRPAQG